jgi:hypothetical protein
MCIVVVRRITSLDEAEGGKADDVQGQRCLVYKRIRDLEKALTKELEGLKGDII